jgi:glycosyltransferase involved in cell wall biosynthesis
VISVVVRTRNERQWIERCLSAIRRQDCDDLEIIVVDNDSTDGTLDVVRRFDCRLLTIAETEFSHGRSINIGISEAKGDFVAIVSGHCIPVNSHWLRRLRLAFADPAVAGVYGRQEPLPDSSDFDKRDLWTAFGLDRRVQQRDNFFHNANSMVRRAVWRTLPFNETLAGVEDRDWAKRALARGYRVVYEPAAGVYHFHGINHGRDQDRAARVARVIELINNGHTDHAHEES